MRWLLTLSCLLSAVPARADIPPAETRACRPPFSPPPSAADGVEVERPDDDAAPPAPVLPAGSLCFGWYLPGSRDPELPRSSYFLPSTGACALGMCSRFVDASGRMWVDLDDAPALDGEDASANREWACYRCVYADPRRTPEGSPAVAVPVVPIALGLVALVVAVVIVALRASVLRRQPADWGGAGRRRR